MAKECPNKIKAPQPQPLQYGGQPAQLHHMEAALEGPYISQGRLEAPPVPALDGARVFSLTKEEAASTSTAVTGQVVIFQHLATILYDTGATHSFVSVPFASKLQVPTESMNSKFLTTLPFGEVMESNQWLRAVLVKIADRELYVNLIVLGMQDFDIIFGMDFLSKYSASVDCRRRKVILAQKVNQLLSSQECQGRTPRNFSHL